MARAVAVRPVLPVAGDRAVDEARVLLAQALVAHTEALEHARPEGLEQHVILARQSQEDVAAALLLEVDADRALVAVQREEHRGFGAVLGPLVVRRRPAHVVPHPGVLDLEHLGPEIGQEQRTEPAGQQPRQIEYPDALERQAHAPTPATARLGTPSISRASATVAGRRPTSSVSCRAFAMRSPFEPAISPLGR